MKNLLLFTNMSNYTDIEYYVFDNMNDEIHGPLCYIERVYCFYERSGIPLIGLLLYYVCDKKKRNANEIFKSKRRITLGESIDVHDFECGQKCCYREQKMVDGKKFIRECYCNLPRRSYSR